MQYTTNQAIEPITRVISHHHHNHHRHHVDASKSLVAYCEYNHPNADQFLFISNCRCIVSREIVAGSLHPKTGWMDEARGRRETRRTRRRRGKVNYVILLAYVLKETPEIGL